MANGECDADVVRAGAGGYLDNGGNFAVVHGRNDKRHHFKRWRMAGAVHLTKPPRTA